MKSVTVQGKVVVMEVYDTMCTCRNPRPVEVDPGPTRTGPSRACADCGSLRDPNGRYWRKG